MCTTCMPAVGGQECPPELEVQSCERPYGWVGKLGPRQEQVLLDTKPSLQSQIVIILKTKVKATKKI